MTDSDINTLKALQTTMQRSVSAARKGVEEHKAQQEAAVAFSPAWEEARRMKAWCEGRLLGHLTALNDLVEAFPDELEEDEYPEENAREARHPLHCKCAECEDGRGDREHETRRDKELDREER